MENTTERAIKLAQNYIKVHEIEDQDLQQDIYLAALEWKSKVDSGCTVQFSTYINKAIKCNPDEGLVYDLYDALLNKSYVVAFDGEFNNELLYQISKLSKRKQKILWGYFIEEKTLAELANNNSVTTTRIAQIINQACRELRSKRTLMDVYSPYSMINNSFIESFKDLVFNGVVPQRIYKTNYDLLKRRPKTYQEAWKSHTDITRIDCIGLKFMESLENGDKLFSIFYKENWFIMRIHTEHDELVFIGDPKIMTTIPMKKLSKVIEFINDNYDNFN